MKRLILSAVVILLSKSLLYSQFDIAVVTIQTVYYQYDEVGNRIQKSILLLKSGNAGDSLPSETPVRDFSFNPEEVMIYPNPTAGQINVEIRTCEATILGDGIFQVAAYDLYGRKVSQKSLRVGESALMNLENEPEGIYFLVIWNKEVSSKWKVVKK